MFIQGFDSLRVCAVSSQLMNLPSVRFKLVDTPLFYIPKSLDMVAILLWVKYAWLAGEADSITATNALILQNIYIIKKNLNNLID